MFYILSCLIWLKTNLIPVVLSCNNDHHSFFLKGPSPSHNLYPVFFVILRELIPTCFLTWVENVLRSFHCNMPSPFCIVVYNSWTDFMFKVIFSYLSSSKIFPNRVAINLYWSQESSRKLLTNEQPPSLCCHISTNMTPGRKKEACVRILTATTSR